MSQELNVNAFLIPLAEAEKIKSESPMKPCPHKHTETIDFSYFTGKVYIRCKDCGIVLRGA